MSQPARRSMSQALQTDKLSPEALAFISEGTPKPQVRSVLVPPAEPPQPTVETPSAVSAPTPEAAIESEEIQGIGPAKAKKPRAPRELPSADAVAAAPASGFVSSTFRLPAEIPPALVQASADRKVKRIKPWSHQDIVAEALSQWLKKNGYLS